MRTPNVYFNAEVRGHQVQFQQLKSGTIRCLGVDRRGPRDWNDRTNSHSTRCSAQAWAEAWDRARLHFYQVATGRAA